MEGFLAGSPPGEFKLVAAGTTRAVSLRTFRMSASPRAAVSGEAVALTALECAYDCTL